METILNRISQIADLEGTSISAIEKAIGASKGVLSRAINNGTDIQAKWIGLIVDQFPRINPEWLLTGEGPVYKPRMTGVQLGDNNHQISIGSGNVKQISSLIRSKKGAVEVTTDLEIENYTLKMEISFLKEKIEMLENTIKDKDNMIRILTK